MSKDSPSFSSLGSEPPPECPTKSSCREVLRQPRGGRGDYILDHPEVLNDVDRLVASDDGAQAALGCLDLNGNRCALDPVVKRDYREYRNRGTTPTV